MNLAAPLYFKSPFQDPASATLKTPGALVRVRAPQSMGKDSFTLNLLEAAKAEGYRIASLDFQGTSDSLLDDLDQFAQWFCGEVGQKLDVPVSMDDYWDDIFGPNDNCTEYFEQYLLDETNPPLTLTLDNFDLLFDHPAVITDFCGLLRGWHEKAKRDARWAQLRLIIAHCQESYETQDINQSPFNVGFPVQLGPWTAAEVAEVIAGNSTPAVMEAELTQIMQATGGHPLLVSHLIKALAGGEGTVESLLQNATTSRGIYAAHLNHRLQYLEARPKLKAAMQKVIQQDQPVNLKPEIGYKLDALGLVTLQSNAAAPLCQIYRDYFREHLSESLG